MINLVLKINNKDKKNSPKYTSSEFKIFSSNLEKLSKIGNYKFNILDPDNQLSHLETNLYSDTDQLQKSLSGCDYFIIEANNFFLPQSKILSLYQNNAYYFKFENDFSQMDLAQAFVQFDNKMQQYSSLAQNIEVKVKDAYTKMECFFIKSGQDLNFKKVVFDTTEQLFCYQTPVDLFKESYCFEETTPALFLDRDGIIIKDTHYPHKKEDLSIIDECTQLIKLAQEKGFKVVVLSNQAGLAKNKFTKQDFKEFSKQFLEQMQIKGVKFNDILYCPYHPEGSNPEFNFFSHLRKPNNAMLLQALEQHHINPYDSIMIGDKPSDQLNFKGLRFYQLNSEYCVDSKSPNLIKSLSEVELPTIC